MSDPMIEEPVDATIPDPVEVAVETTLTDIGIALPTDAGARFRAVEAAREAGLDKIDAEEMFRRHEEVWGVREVARHLGISWRLAQKWAREGRLPTLPQVEWVKGPVTVYRQHFRQTPLGLEHAGTTEEARIVDKIFDAAAIKAIDVNAIRDQLVFEWLDERADAIEELVSKGTSARVAKSLGRFGVTADRLSRWLAARRAP